MLHGKKIGLYLPCRNESQSLEHIFRNIPPYVDSVLVVSNKSTDSTLEVCRKNGISVVEDDRVDQNGIGYGYAHQTGMKECSGEILITMDADGTYPLEQSDQLIGRLVEGNLDFVSGTRYPHGKANWILRVGTDLLSAATRIFQGPDYKDILSGMWVIRKDFAKKIDCQEGGWNLSIEVKVNAANLGRAEEFSIYPRRRNDGQTKQNYIKTGLTHLWWILRASPEWNGYSEPW